VFSSSYITEVDLTNELHHLDGIKGNFAVSHQNISLSIIRKKAEVNQNWSLPM